MFGECHFGAPGRTAAPHAPERLQPRTDVRRSCARCADRNPTGLSERAKRSRITATVRNRAAALMLCLYLTMRFCVLRSTAFERNVRFFDMFGEYQLLVMERQSMMLSR